jgi:two-component system, NarL family, response regulator LiaR
VGVVVFLIPLVAAILLWTQFYPLDSWLLLGSIAGSFFFGLYNHFIVKLTSHDTETEMMAAFTSGADAYYIKGTNLKGLLAAIAAAQEGAVYIDPQIASQAIAYFQPQAKLKNNPSDRLSQQLYISVSTVKTHVRSIMNKLAVDDRVQAAVVALRSGLVN